VDLIFIHEKAKPPDAGATGRTIALPAYVMNVILYLLAGHLPPSIPLRLTQFLFVREAFDLEKDGLFLK
jgi:hypothetical protein